MRSNYWSYSKFADWVRGTPKPVAATSEEWNAWHKSAKTQKIRYWLVEDGFDYLQNFVSWPMDRIHDLNHYINNRWTSKTHALTSNLKRGQWHELDTRILHCLFDELVNFVEIDEALMQVISSDEEWQKYRAPWYRTLFSIRAWRSQEAGLAHLEWAAGLKDDEEWMNKDDPNYGQPTSYAIAAKEIIALYKWWKEERPNRSDPMEVSGLRKHYNERKTAVKACEDHCLWDSLHESGPERDHLIQMLELCHKMEQEQENDDTEKLIRLVKLRNRLWT